VESSGENSIIVVPRANDALTSSDVDRTGAAIRSARVVMLQLEVPTDVVIAAAASARRAGATVVLNPAPAVVDPGRFAGLVDVVVPNESELAALCGVDGDDPGAGALVLAKVTGARAIVVTLGSRGALVWTPDGVTSVRSHTVATIDTVGAGDAFCGVLAAGLAAGASLTDAVRHANAAGAIATTRAGSAPSMPTRDEVDLLLAGGGQTISRALRSGSAG
jgi:ribokinase